MCHFFDLNLLYSRSFDGFKCVEATLNKRRKTIFCTSLLRDLNTKKEVWINIKAQFYKL